MLSSSAKKKEEEEEAEKEKENKNKKWGKPLATKPSNRILSNGTQRRGVQAHLIQAPCELNDILLGHLDDLIQIRVVCTDEFGGGQGVELHLAALHPPLKIPEKEFSCGAPILLSHPRTLGQATAME